MNKALTAFAIATLGCVSQFRGATPIDEAQCRNVARAISAGTQGWAAAVVAADAYDDCMRGKGYQEEP